MGQKADLLEDLKEELKQGRGGLKGTGEICEFKEDYLSLGVDAPGGDLDEEKLKRIIKRHLTTLLGRTSSVKEYLEVVREIRDLCGWKKSAEVHAANTKPTGSAAEEASIAQLRKLVEKE